MLACGGNPEIELMSVCPVSREIEWTRGYGASPEIESTPARPVSLETASMLAGRDRQTSVDLDVLAYKTARTELLIRVSFRIGVRRIWVASTTIGKTMRATLAISTA